LLLSPAASAAAACSALGSRRGGGGEEARVSPAALAWGRREREGGRKRFRNEVLVAISFLL